MENNLNKRIITAFTYFVLALFVFLTFAQSQKKFALDELDFPIVAKTTSETGKPVYYRGEASPEHLGLYHPPLYIYALAAQIKVFGFSENTIRAFGLACTLITAYLILNFSKTLVPDRDIDIHKLFFLAVFLLNPYTLANTTLPDIDSTILPPLVTAFVITLIRDKKNSLMLMSLFFLLLWTKLTTPLALVPFSIIYWKLNGKSFREILFAVVYIFFGSTFLFLFTYWVYCKSLDLPFAYVFGFLIHSFTKGSASTGIFSVLARIWENLEYAKNLLAAITIPFFFLFSIASVFFLIQRKKTKPQKDMVFVVGLVVFVSSFYCSLIAPFGGFFKYPFAIFQLACLCISVFCVRSIEEINRKKYFFYLLFAVFVIASTYIWAVFDYKKPTLGPSSSLMSVLIIASVAGVSIGGMIQRNIIFSRTLHYFVLAALALTIVTSFEVSRKEAIAPFPTKYSFGQSGMEETISYLRANLKPNEVIWSMKDIGYYSGNRYIENYDVFFNPNPSEKIQEAVKSGVRYFVTTQGIGEDRIDAYPKIEEAIASCCKLEKNFGNFYIYTSK